jgi:hypothetical protein
MKVVTMHKKDASAIVLTAWMLTVSGFMYMFRIPDLRLFLASCLVGLFIIVYMIHPVFSKPRYIRGMYAMTIGYMVLFGAIIVLELLELFS